MPAGIPCNGELEAKARTAPHITTGFELQGFNCVGLSLLCLSAPCLFDVAVLDAWAWSTQVLYTPNPIWFLLGQSTILAQ